MEGINDGPRVENNKPICRFKTLEDGTEAKTKEAVACEGLCMPG